MNQSLNLAFKYTEESIEKCRQLAEFLKKRQEIEDEYAKSLSKQSLTPKTMLTELFSLMFRKIV